MIPITNLYYLLCYAWNKLDERDYVDIDALPRQDLPNLLGSVLASGTRRLLRRGVERTYFTQAEDSSNPRGKIDLSQSLKRAVFFRNQLTCIVDELSHDTLHNRIVRATLNTLASTTDVSPKLRHELRSLERRFETVQLIALKSEHFARVQLHRNNSFYRFLLNVCELVFHSLLATEQSGEYKFREFVRDEVRMRKVFQDFIFNFYRFEQRLFNVRSERFRWDINFADDQAKMLLPEMNTDVCLTSNSRKIVIECKYSTEALQEHRGKLSARSEHLYQLFAYLKNLEARGGLDEQCDGLLIYPAATHELDFMFNTQGHTIRVVTLDLRPPWVDIKNQLLSIIEPWRSDAPSAAA